MKVAAYTIVASVAAITVSDFTPTPEAVQYGALAILGWVVWYLLARTLPRQAEAAEREREAFRASLASLTSAVDRVTTALITHRTEE